jgi:hypothetical protein
MGVILESARVSRADDGVPGTANSSYICDRTKHERPKVRFRATPKPPRETRALPNHRLAAPGLGGGLGRGLGVVWGL